MYGITCHHRGMTLRDIVVAACLRAATIPLKPKVSAILVNTMISELDQYITNRDFKVRERLGDERVSFYEAC